jgi:hypothetical protein
MGVHEFLSRRSVPHQEKKRGKVAYTMRSLNKSLFSKCWRYSVDRHYVDSASHLEYLAVYIGM